MSTDLHLPSPTPSWKWSFGEQLPQAETRFIVTDYHGQLIGNDEMKRGAIQIKKCITCLMR